MKIRVLLIICALAPASEAMASMAAVRGRATQQLLAAARRGMQPSQIARTRAFPRTSTPSRAMQAQPLQTTQAFRQTATPQQPSFAQTRQIMQQQIVPRMPSAQQQLAARFPSRSALQSAQIRQVTPQEVQISRPIGRAVTEQPMLTPRGAARRVEAEVVQPVPQAAPGMPLVEPQAAAPLRRLPVPTAAQLAGTAAVATAAAVGAQLVRGTSDEQAFVNQEPSVLYEYLAGGVNPNARDADNNSLLHMAVQQTTAPQKAEMILYYGADVNARNRQGEAPIHLATSPRMVDQLVSYGASILARDASGMTPAERADQRFMALANDPSATNEDFERLGAVSRQLKMYEQQERARGTALPQTLGALGVQAPEVPAETVVDGQPFVEPFIGIQMPRQTQQEATTPTWWQELALDQPEPPTISQASETVPTGAILPIRKPRKTVVTAYGKVVDPKLFDVAQLLKEVKVSPLKPEVMQKPTAQTLKNDKK